MKFYLIVAKGKHQGLPIPIEIDLFMIGSDPSCQLRSTHPTVAERHCALVSRDRKVFIRDMGGQTLVNDEPMPENAEWPLHAGDKIKVGPLEFIIQFREKPLSQRDLEEWALRCLDEAQSTKKLQAVDELVMMANAKTHSLDAAQAAAAILDRLSAQRGVVRGRLRISREGNVTVVRINDVYLVDEAELAHIDKELRDNLNAQSLRVLLDFKNVRRMSSAGAMMVANLARWLRHNNSTLAICRLRDEFREMLSTVLGRTIPVYPDKPTALMAEW